MIERPGQRNHAPRADQAVGRFQTDDAAVRGRLSDRAGRIRPERGITKTPGDRRSRAARRTAGDMRALPGIVYAAEVRHQGATAERELVHVGLAQHHRARRFEPAHHLSILGRDTILEDSAPRGRPHAGCVEEIL